MQSVSTSPSQTTSSCLQQQDTLSRQKKSPELPDSANQVPCQENNSPNKRDQGALDDAIQTEQASAQKATAPAFGTVYDDPAIIRVVERQKHRPNAHASRYCLDCCESGLCSDDEAFRKMTKQTSTHKDTDSTQELADGSSQQICGRVWHLIAKQVDDEIEAQMRLILAENDVHPSPSCHHHAQRHDSATSCRWSADSHDHVRKRRHLGRQEHASALCRPHACCHARLDDMDHTLAAIQSQLQSMIQSAGTNRGTLVAMKPEECVVADAGAGAIEEQTVPLAAPGDTSRHPTLQHSQRVKHTNTDDLVAKITRLEAENAALASTVDELKKTLHRQREEAQDARRERWIKDVAEFDAEGRQNGKGRLTYLEQEYQAMQTRLSEEQWKYSQLENKCAALYKRQADTVRQSDRLALRVKELEAELHNVAQRGTWDVSNRPPMLQQPQPVEPSRKPSLQNDHHRGQRRPAERKPSMQRQQQHPQQHQHQHHHHQQQQHQHQQQLHQSQHQLQQQQHQQLARISEYRNAPNKLPTPRSSPSTSHQEEEGSYIKEEDGYLVFNSNIDGEVIHCRVKIPSSRATSIRSSPVLRRPVDFPLALVSPPITPQQRCKSMVPPLRDLLKTRKGLNPNAPEWNGSYKQPSS